MHMAFQLWSETINKISQASCGVLVKEEKKEMSYPIQLAEPSQFSLQFLHISKRQTSNQF